MKMFRTLELAVEFYKSRIYQIADGSLRECQVILRLAEIEDEKLLALSNHLGISMYKLIKAMNDRV